MSRNIRTAVVLGGGAGLRLRPLTNDLPKVMLRVADKPLLEYVINWLRQNSVTNIVIGVAYRKDTVTGYFRNGRDFGVDIRYSEHTVEGGTGEGFRLAIEKYVDDDVFIATNGDEITDIDVESFARFHNEGGKVATVALSPLKSPFGVVQLDGQRNIVRFQEKPVLRDYWVSMGVYVFEDTIKEYLPVKGNVETESFPRLAREGKIRGYTHDGLWRTVNTFKDLQELEATLSRNPLSNLLS